MDNGIKNQTKQDALDRLLMARIGMLAHNPTEEYLLIMQRELQVMLSVINAELYQINVEHRH